MGSQSFVGLFGSAEATFETEYVYIGDNQITEYGIIPHRLGMVVAKANSNIQVMKL